MSEANAKLNAFPVFMRVEGEAVAIVGGGEEALAKARLLGQSSAVLRIIADAAEAELLELHRCHRRRPRRCRLRCRASGRRDLVFAASGEEALDRRVAADARAAGHSGQCGRPARALRFLYTCAGQPRPGCDCHRHRRGRTGAGRRSCAASIDRMLSPSLGALRDACRFVPRCCRAAAAEGQWPPPLLERFLRRRAGARRRGRRAFAGARRGSSICLSPTRRPQATSRWSARARARKTF